MGETYGDAVRVFATKVCLSSLLILVFFPDCILCLELSMNLAALASLVS
jgi:hypothetical protein